MHGQQNIKKNFIRIFTHNFTRLGQLIQPLLQRFMLVPELSRVNGTWHFAQSYVTQMTVALVTVSVNARLSEEIKDLVTKPRVNEIPGV